MRVAVALCAILALLIDAPHAVAGLADDVRAAREAEGAYRSALETLAPLERQVAAVADPYRTRDVRDDLIVARVQAESARQRFVAQAAAAFQSYGAALAAEPVAHKLSPEDARVRAILQDSVVRLTRGSTMFGVLMMIHIEAHLHGTVAGGVSTLVGGLATAWAFAQSARKKQVPDTYEGLSTGITAAVGAYGFIAPWFSPEALMSVGPTFMLLFLQPLRMLAHSRLPGMRETDRLSDDDQQWLQSRLKQGAEVVAQALSQEVCGLALRPVPVRVEAPADDDADGEGAEIAAIQIGRRL